MDVTVTIQRGNEVESFTFKDPLLQQIAPGAPDLVWVNQIKNAVISLMLQQLINVTGVDPVTAATTIVQNYSEAS